MKTIKLTFLLIVAIGLMSTMTVLAQSIDPGEELEAILTSDVAGAWTMQFPLGTSITSAYCAEFSSDASQVRYGANSSQPDFATACDNTPFTEKSGLGFVGNTGIEILCQLPNEPAPTFQLGEFTHYNNPVFAEGVGDPALDGRLKKTQLEITLTGDIGSVLNYDVIFEETRNGVTSYPNTDYSEFNTNHSDVSGQCPYPLGTAPGDAAYDAVNDPDGDGTYSCSDRVTFENITADDEFTDVNGNSCTITILGFGSCASEPTVYGEVEFVTVEGEQNDSCLYATTALPGITAVSLSEQSTGSAPSVAMLIVLIVSGLAGVTLISSSRRSLLD